MSADTPRTAAGRKLLDKWGTPAIRAWLAQEVLAIEAEAAAGSGALRAALERIANAADVMLHAEDYSHRHELELIRAEKQARAALATPEES